MTQHRHTIPKGANQTASVTDPDLTPYAKTVQVQAEAANRIAADNALGARVTTLEAGMANALLRIAAVEAHFTPPAPPSGVVKAFPGSGANTIAAFQAMTTDTTIDVIEMAAGVYPWRAAAITADRTARPLVIRPAVGATVEFNCAGDGDWGDPIFELNGCAYVTFDGSPGLFYFHHILLAEEGLFTAVGASHVTLNHIKVRNVAGNTHAADQESAHCVYVSHGCHDFILNYWDCASLQAADESGGVYGVNGLQLYTGGTGAAIYNVTATHWTVDHANWATVVRNSSTGLIYSNWVVSYCGQNGAPAAMDFGSSGNTGTVSNVTTTASVGTPHIMGSMTDGGGNSWA